jgi:hypothetical protein
MDKRSFLSSIKFIGHNQRDGHDKIWGYLQMPDDGFVTFWGRRTGGYTFKRAASYADSSSVYTKARDQEVSGYVGIDVRALGVALTTKLFERFVATVLLDNFHGDRPSA